MWRAERQWQTFSNAKFSTAINRKQDGNSQHNINGSTEMYFQNLNIFFIYDVFASPPFPPAPFVDGDEVAAGGACVRSTDDPLPSSVIAAIFDFFFGFMRIVANLSLSWPPLVLTLENI